MNLNFKTYIELLYPSDSQKVIEALSIESPIIFRINTLKSAGGKAYPYLRGPFENTFIVNSLEEKHKLTESTEFKNGEIYFQSLSSMFAVKTLDPKEGDNILDLCAAPGSKTSYIAQLTNNKSKITAIENNRNRFFAMQSNLISLGVTNTNLIMNNASIIDKLYPQFINSFDKVLADVPCSNDTLINLQKEDAQFSIKSSKRLSQLQKGLIENAFNMTKPGGTLIYSTCTFSPYENEMVIDWFLSRHTNATLEHIDLFCDELKVLNGIKEWNEKEFKHDLSRVIRVIPNNLFTGFFIAKIKKVSTSF